MLRRNIQTAIWKYDKHFAAVVALLPSNLQSHSSKLGRMTLPSIWAAVLIITCLLLASAGYQKIAILGVIIIVCIPIGSVLKLLVRRSRPKTIYAQNMKIKSYSFPSSHTYSATIAGGYLAFLSFVLLPMPISMIASGLLATLIVVIGISRVHVGAHYPSDVTAGWILGAIVLFAVIKTSI